MRILVTDVDARSASVAADALRLHHPEWEIAAYTVSGSAVPPVEDWDLVIWDLAAGEDLPGGKRGCTVLWAGEDHRDRLCAAPKSSDLPRLLRSGRWTETLLEVVRRVAPACEQSATSASQVGRQAADCLCTAKDLPTALAQAVSAAGQAGGYHVGLIAILDTETGELEHYASGLSDDAGQEIAEAVLAELTAETRDARARSVLIERTSDLGGTPESVRLRHAYEKRSIVGHCRVVLTLGETVVGALVLATTQFRDCTTDEALRLTELGLETALAVSRLVYARLDARNRHERARLLEASASLGAGNDLGSVLRAIARSGQDVANGVDCAIRVLAEDRRRFTAVHCAEPRDPACTDDPLEASDLEWLAVNAGETAVKPGVGGTGPSVAIPIKLDRQPVGTLYLTRRSGTGFRAHEISALSFLAAQAAVAIHNASLYEIANRRSRHMEVVAAQAWQEEARARALFEVATAVTEKMDLPDILATVTSSACTEVGFERARIYLTDHEKQVLVGQMEARANADPTPLLDQAIPLHQESDHPLAQAAMGSAPYVIEGITHPEPDDGRAEERLLIPLVGQGILVGLLVADNPGSGNPVSPQRTRLLHSLAGLASVAIERARVDKLRGTLISSVSHELRAPLASIRAYNELVMGGDVGEVNDEQKLFLGRVERACDRLERLIQDLMNLSKLRTGDVSIKKAPADLANVIRGVLDTMHPKAANAGVTLNFHEEAKLPMTMTDQGRLEQVLTNLVDNAIKFNEAGGTVDVTLAQDGMSAVISVADDGPGIPRAAQSIIFEEFQHGTDERSRAKEGAGLGLAIARRVVGVMGGKLWLESEMGKGSTFYVSLRLEPVDGIQADSTDS